MVNLRPQAADRKRAAAGKPDVWLAVETSTPSGSVAVWKDGLAFEQTLRIQGTHSERLVPAIQHALAASETSPEQVTDFVVGSGPGSFTGVRLAASLAKGWVMARQTRLFAYPSLLAVAAGSGSKEPVCALFDARRGEVYAACYDVVSEILNERLPPGAWRIPDLLAELSARELEPAFAGEGAATYREAIRAAWPDAEILPEHLGVPRAASLLWLRGEAPDMGRVDRPDAWEPVYVRDWRIPDDRGRP
ncbi:MAG: tRNA (adenosine(37)-N6)-threonylcarbamoyltransferase complex dimerization subunit type 1 TsaB [Gemmatimonadales bacterium]